MFFLYQTGFDNCSCYQHFIHVSKEIQCLSLHTGVVCYCGKCMHPKFLKQCKRLMGVRVRVKVREL